MLKISNIKYLYENTSALNDVSFEVEKGEIFGLIGPDGSGKTTLFRLIATLLEIQQGEAILNGENVDENFEYVRTHIGYMPGKFSLYQDLTVRENLDFFARVMKTTIEENRHLIDDIYRQLEPFENRRAGALSGGMKQKLALCCALIHKPLMLLLDEPTTGVDALSRIEFWDMLHNLKSQGMTILVSTPYMDESSRCDRIALIQEGEILKIDSPQNIIKEFKKQVFSIKGERLYTLLKQLRKEQADLKVYPFGESLHAYTDPSEDFNSLIENHLQEHKLQIDKIEANIEDVFMNLMSNTSQ